MVGLLRKQQEPNLGLGVCCSNYPKIPSLIVSTTSQISDQPQLVCTSVDWLELAEISCSFDYFLADWLRLP